MRKKYESIKHPTKQQRKERVVLTWIAGVLTLVLVFSILVLILQAERRNHPSVEPVRIFGGSDEREYLESRFKQEGYSDSEAREGADAILRFEDAQGR